LIPAEFICYVLFLDALIEAVGVPVALEELTCEEELNGLHSVHLGKHYQINYDSNILNYPQAQSLK
jgi:hypothetical protein